MDATTLRSPLKKLAPKKPVCVKPDVTVARVIDILKDKRIGCVFVTEDDKLVGIITERDILKKVVWLNLAADIVTAAEVMTHSPEYLFEDDEIAFALNRMHVGGFRHIPIVDLKLSPKGIVSVRDLLRFLDESVKTEAF